MQYSRIRHFLLVSGSSQAEPRTESGGMRGLALVRTIGRDKASLLPRFSVRERVARADAQGTGERKIQLDIEVTE